MTDDDEMRPEYDFTNAVKNPHAAKLGEVCTHGSLKRQCEICGLESQVEFWHDEVTKLQMETTTYQEEAARALARVTALEGALADAAAATERLHADVDFAARKLMPAHDLLAECLDAGIGESKLREKVLAWLGPHEAEHLAGRKAE